MELTPAFNDYIESKLRPLDKFFKKIENEEEVILRLEVAGSTKHHKKGNVYLAEANIDFRGRVLRAVAPHSDPRLALNEMKRKLEMEIKKYKEKSKEGIRKSKKYKQ